MPLIRFPTVKGLVYTIDLSKIADRENPRTVEAPVLSNNNNNKAPENLVIDWGDGSSTIVTQGQSAHVAHVYPDNAGELFTVVIRSTTGHLPVVVYNNGDSYSAEPSYNLTLAVVSIDHFSGEIGTGVQTNSAYYLGRNAHNLQYIDTRYVGYPNWRNYNLGLYRCYELDQDAESFCFDFTDATSFGALFNNCYKLHGTVGRNFFRNKSNLSSVSQMFQNCTSLGSVTQDALDGCSALTTVNALFRESGIDQPYIFWDESGNTDTDRFPVLVETRDCYLRCPNIDLAQVPTTYGGTMSVS